MSKLYVLVLIDCVVLRFDFRRAESVQSLRSFVQNYLKASPLPPAPLAVAGFMVAGLAAWQYSDRLAGLLGFAVCFLFC